MREKIRGISLGVTLVITKEEFAVFLAALESERADFGFLVAFPVDSRFLRQLRMWSRLVYRLREEEQAEECKRRMERWRFWGNRVSVPASPESRLPAWVSQYLDYKFNLFDRSGTSSSPMWRANFPIS